MKARLVVLNLTGAAILAALAIAGLLTDAVMGPARFGVATISALVVVAVAQTYRGNYRMASFITKRLTAVGLAGTVIGIILALTSLQSFGDAGAFSEIARGAGLAMYSTAAGIIAWLYMDCCLYLAGREGGE